MIELPKSKYTNILLGEPDPTVTEYLLAHESSGNNFDPLIGYAVHSSIYLRKDPEDRARKGSLWPPIER
jgi:hypothetical protein